MDENSYSKKNGKNSVNVTKNRNKKNNEKKLKNLIEKKIKGGYNTNWRIRDEEYNILGYIKTFNTETFILIIDNELPKDNNFTFIVNHPLVTEEFKIKAEILRRKEINEIADEVEVLIEFDNDESEKLSKYLEMFYSKLI